MLDGVRAALGDQASVPFQPGCEDGPACADTSGFDDAVAAARGAAATVLLLGTRATGGDGCTPRSCEDEGADRASIRLPEAQYTLATRLAGAAPRLVCVLVHGGTLELGSLLRDCDAILSAGFPGAQGALSQPEGCSDGSGCAACAAGRASSCPVQVDRPSPPRSSETQRLPAARPPPGTRRTPILRAPRA